jgi:hypothetical protein
MGRSTPIEPYIPELRKDYYEQLKRAHDSKRPALPEPEHDDTDRPDSSGFGEGH